MENYCDLGLVFLSLIRVCLASQYVQLLQNKAADARAVQYVGFLICS